MESNRRKNTHAYKTSRRVPFDIMHIISNTPRERAIHMYDVSVCVRACMASRLKHKNEIYVCDASVYVVCRNIHNRGVPTQTKWRGLRRVSYRAAETKRQRNRLHTYTQTIMHTVDSTEMFTRGILRDILGMQK